MPATRSLRNAATAAGLLAIGVFPPEALAATAVGHVSVTIIPTIAVVEQSPLEFGRVGVTKAGARVVLTPNGTKAGPGAHALDAGSRPGRFTITGAPNEAITVSFSAGDAARGPGPAMPVGPFTHDGGRSPSLNGAGTLTLTVGATVAINASQPYGAYGGTYTVVVNY